MFRMQFIVFSILKPWEWLFGWRFKQHISVLFGFECMCTVHEKRWMNRMSAFVFWMLNGLFENKRATKEKRLWMKKVIIHFIMTIIQSAVSNVAVQMWKKTSKLWCEFVRGADLLLSNVTWDLLLVWAMFECLSS